MNDEIDNSTKEPEKKKGVFPNPNGRPLKWESPQEMQIAIDLYFDKCDREKRPYTVSGLAYALDTDRELLLNYQKKDLYSNTITRAKKRIVAYAEETLWNAKNPSGVIFSMKNNFPLAFRDKVETEQSGEITIKWAD